MALSAIEQPSIYIQYKYTTLINVLFKSNIHISVYNIRYSDKYSESPCANFA